MAATTRENAANEDFVTIVSVGNTTSEGETNKVNKPASDLPFVTVLSIGQQGAEEEVTVYRLPGEKLGFGLKFEGGVQSAECVRRLFIQSCAPESPAGRTRAAWGPLEPGDEILCIDRVPVSSLTRLECVRCLKDSNLAVKLLVRHTPEGKLHLNDGNRPRVEHDSQESEKSLLPPPVPPRKIHKKKELINGDSNKTVFINGTKAYENTTIERKVPLGKQSPGRPRRPAPIHSATPPEAQVYTDLFCREKENGFHIAESESDDTGSSISTVIDRLSAYSSFPGSVDNSIPSTPTLGPKHLNVNVQSAKILEERFLSELPARMLEEFNKEVNVAVRANDAQMTNGDSRPTQGDVSIVVSSFESGAPVKSDCSDANNNTNTIKIVGKVNEDVKEIPKPLPRNLNKRNVDSALNDFNRVNRPYDDNLSPTKLQNIETWLQDAIDCNMRTFDDVDHHDYDREMKPEALPRLIDFVPKQKNESPVPTERKEVDYSVKLAINVEKEPEVSDGMSSDYDGSPHLETIGEDDEDSPNCQTLPIIKVTQQSPNSNGEVQFPVEVTIQNEYKQPEQPKAEVALPKKEKEPEECGVVTRGARSPPDGRENPMTHQESAPIFTNIAPTKIPPMQDTFIKQKPNNYIKEAAFAEPIQRSISYDPPTFKSNTISTKYGGRGKDAKSEGSVKDKIAMFSSNKTPEKVPERKSSLPTKPLDTRPPQNRYSGLYADSLSKSYESLLDASKTISKSKVTKSNQDWNVNGSSIKSRDTPSETVTALPYANISYDSRNASEVDRAKDVKITPFEIRSDKSKGDSHRSTIDWLIEQRRKSMTKLRCLVIPDSPCLQHHISNLPEIKSKDSLKKFDANPIIDKANHTDRFSSKKQTIAMTPMWDTQPYSSNVPKYSPAFKRKPLQVYGPKVTNGVDKTITKTPAPSKPPRISIDTKRIYDRVDATKKVSTLPMDFRSSRFSPSSEIKRRDAFSLDSVDSANIKMMKAFSDAADSDNDSALSSTQSSYLSTVSSPTPSLNAVDNSESDCSSRSTPKSRFENGYMKADVCRSLSSDTSASGSSNSSTLTSGSQASCSSAGSSNTDSHRVLKPRSIEAINRKNILASAKCRSGKDNKFGSPLIERKFSDVDSADDECERKVVAKSEIVRYNTVTSRPSSLAADSVLKVAYATLVEDERCSDSACSESEGHDEVVTVDEFEPRRPVANGVSRDAKEVEAVQGKVDTRKECESSEEEDFERFEVRLSRGGGGSVGVILAGGVDCEAKEVTIHKVLQGSAAERDGRLCKGDKVISINGQSMRGVTHAESVAILKDPQPEVSIFVRGKHPIAEVQNNFTSLTNGSAATLSVQLEKADAPGGAGLGISLEGGGNKPLLINKLFTGGAASRSGKITSGSELIAAGGTKLVGLTRTEAWGLLRALPPGPVTLVLRPP